MTMPKFEPVAEVLWYDPALRHTPEPAGKIIDGSMSFIESAAIGTQLYTADQLTEAYEAGKRDATPEGYALVPKQPTLLMLRAMYPCESTTEAYKAMLAAAPERRRMMTLVELLQQAASESDTPNTSIEGKAANLIERQAAQIEMMREALGYRIDHPKVITALSFTPDQALEQFAAKVRSQCESVARSGEWGLTKTGKAIAAAIGRIKDLP